LLEYLLLEIDALLGELILGRHLAAQCVQGIEQADGERRAGAHAAPGRQVAVVVQLDAALDAQEAQRFPDRGMADLLDVPARLDLAIDDARAVLEEGR